MNSWLLDLQHFRAHQAGVAYPAADCQRENQAADALAPKSDQGQGQQDAGKSQDEIGAAHDARVEHAAMPAGQEAHAGTEAGGDESGSQADGQRDQSAERQAGKQVATQGVRAQEVRRGGRLQALVDMQPQADPLESDRAGQRHAQAGQDQDAQAELPVFLMKPNHGRWRG